MKHYLERNGIKVVDAEPIQYGAKEFAVKKPDGEGEIMPVLVDFAHGKPMFVIHTDHHDTQAGVEGDTSTSFKSARSNVETISQSISPSEIFPPEDVETISIVDSADFAKHDIKPRDVINYLFQIDRTKGFKENKRKMGFVANKLLLAFKNKPNFLSDIVLNAQPSLLSILMNIKDQIQKKGYATLLAAALACLRENKAMKEMLLQSIQKITNRIMISSIVLSIMVLQMSGFTHWNKYHTHKKQGMNSKENFSEQLQTIIFLKVFYT